jgi:hypothetical protein
MKTKQRHAKARATQLTRSRKQNSAMQKRARSKILPAKK